VAKRLVLPVFSLISASQIGSAQDIQDLGTVSGILSWMFNIQSADFKYIVIFIVVAALVLLAVTVIGTLFWIRMLSDALNRKFEDESDKIAWVLVITFTHDIGAMLYYKLVKSKTDPGISPKTE
jgi:hypothetical protein